MQIERPHSEMENQSPLDKMFDTYNKTRVEKDPLAALIELRGSLRTYPELDVPAKVDILRTKADKELEALGDENPSNFDLRAGIGQQMKEYMEIIATHEREQGDRRYTQKATKQEQKRWGLRKR